MPSRIFRKRRKNRSRAREAFNLMETLEPRMLLNGTITFDAGTGTLTIEGTNDPDRVVIRRPTGGANGDVEVRGGAQGAGGETMFSDVKCIVINTHGGNDFVRIFQPRNPANRPLDPDGNPIKAEINGGAGDDTLEGGAGNDTIVGGEGNDKIRGNDGNDSLSGGDGNDDIDGNDGNDTLNGGDGADHLKDTRGDNTFQGGAGFDRVSAGNGNDNIDLGADGGVITREDGGDNTLNGGTGGSASMNLGGNGTNTITGNDTATTVSSRRAGINFTGMGDGADRILIGSVPVVNINTGGGDDFVRAGRLPDADIDMGAGNDSLRALFGNNLGVMMGDGDDQCIIGGPRGGRSQSFAAININLGGGNDMGNFNVNPRNQMSIGGIVILGEAGDDTINANFVKRFNPPFAADVNGGLGNDNLIVRSARNTSVDGGDGNNMIRFWLSGIDRFVNAIDIDLIGGDGNNDIQSFFSFRRGVLPTVNIHVGDGDDLVRIFRRGRGTSVNDGIFNIDLGNGANTFIGSRFNENILGGDDMDCVNLGGGMDTANGGGGLNDTVNIFRSPQGTHSNFESIVDTRAFATCP